MKNASAENQILVLLRNTFELLFPQDEISKKKEKFQILCCNNSARQWSRDVTAVQILTSVAEMAPVEEPEAKVRMRVESLDCTQGPRFIFTRSKWCFDPTKSLTKLEEEAEEAEAGFEVEDDEDGGCSKPVEVSEKMPAPQPLSSRSGLLTSPKVAPLKCIECYYLRTIIV